MLGYYLYNLTFSSVLTLDSTTNRQSQNENKPNEYLQTI